MAITVDLLERRKTEFLVWCPSNKANAPELIIGQLQEGNPPRFAPIARQPFTLQRVAGLDGLWRIAASACGLQNGQVYHYWFRVDDSRSGANPPARVVV